MSKALVRSFFLLTLALSACTVQNSDIPGLSGPSEGTGPLQAPIVTPTARFSFSPSAPPANAPVQFDGTLSCVGPADPNTIAPCGTAGGAITSYSWNFGDGTAASGPVASHAYGVPATYGVTLTVVNSSGRSHTTSHPVPVAVGLLPTAAFTVSPSAPKINFHDVTFDASSSTAGVGHSIVQYRWQFGDNYQTGCTNWPTYCYVTTSPVVQHKYIDVGTWTTTLTVVDESGQTNTLPKQVTTVP